MIYRQQTMWNLTHIVLALHVCPQSAQDTWPPNSSAPLSRQGHCYRPAFVRLPSRLGLTNDNDRAHLDRFYNRLKLKEMNV